jgi:DNA-binding response OmpR family regulator
MELDLARRQAWWHLEPLALTPLQFRLMSLLILAGGAVVTTEELSRALWGTALPSDAERLFAHIRRIRKRIEPDPARPQFLLTVRGEGFRLAEAG